jgi:hypothetical protein
MKIVIDFDEKTQEIVSVTVGDSVKTPTVKKSKVVVVDDTIGVTLDSNKLIVTPALATLLKVKEGDRLVIRYKEDGEFIEPFLAPPTVFNEEGGNKLTKALTISFRGDQHVALSRFGNVFEVLDMKDGSVKLIGATKVKDVVPSITLEALAPQMNIGDDLVLTKTSFVIK